MTTRKSPPFNRAPRNAQERAALEASYAAVYRADNGARVLRPGGWRPEGGKELLIARMVAAATGDNVHLAPRVETEGLKLVDAWRCGEGWEFERVNPTADSLKNAVKQRLRDGKKQAPRITVFLDNDLVEPPLTVSVEEIRKLVNGGIANAIFFDGKNQIQIVEILLRSGDHQALTRQQFEDDGLRFDIFRERP